MKAYTTGQVMEKFDKLPRLKQIELLWDAMDIMQGYNGYSRAHCACLAMGYETTDGTTWTKPKEK